MDQVLFSFAYTLLIYFNFQKSIQPNLSQYSTLESVVSSSSDSEQATLAYMNTLPPISQAKYHIRSVNSAHLALAYTLSFMRAKPKRTFSNINSILQSIQIFVSLKLISLFSYRARCNDWNPWRTMAPNIFGMRSIQFVIPKPLTSKFTIERWPRAWL